MKLNLILLLSFFVSLSSCSQRFAFREKMKAEKQTTVVTNTKNDVQHKENITADLNTTPVIIPQTVTATTEEEKVVVIPKKAKTLKNKVRLASALMHLNNREPEKIISEEASIVFEKDPESEAKLLSTILIVILLIIILVPIIVLLTIRALLNSFI